MAAFRNVIPQHAQQVHMMPAAHIENGIACNHGKQKTKAKSKPDTGDLILHSRGEEGVAEQSRHAAMHCESKILGIIRPTQIQMHSEGDNTS